MSVHKVSNSNECCLNLPRLSKLIDVITEGFDYISQVLRIRTTEKQIEEERHRKYKERFFKTVPEDDVVGGSVEGDG